MRIDIKEPYDEKLLRDAQKLNMSPTQYLCYLLDLIEIEEPKQQKLMISKPSPRVKRKTNPGGGSWDVNY
mgnify:CR=1 FL=1